MDLPAFLYSDMKNNPLLGRTSQKLISHIECWLNLEEVLYMRVVFFNVVDTLPAFFRVRLVAIICDADIELASIAIREGAGNLLNAFTADLRSFSVKK